jgi:protein-S-isoprenylcysteine O-methyltransferase Ste14
MTALWLSGNIAAMRMGWGDATFWESPIRWALILLLCANGLLMACLTGGQLGDGETDAPDLLRRRFKIACFGVFWALFLVYLPACDHAGTAVFPEGGWLVPIRAVGLVFLASGGLLRLMAVRAREAAEAANPARAAGLAKAAGPMRAMTFAKTGVYHAIRHPEYLGILLVLLGWVLAFRSFWGLGVWALWIAVVGVRIRHEEARLLDALKMPYRRYQSVTWRLVPGIY